MKFPGKGQRRHPFSVSYSPANICLDEDVLKTSRRCLSFSSSEDVFKTSSRHLGQDRYIPLSQTSWQDVFKTFSRRLQDVFKTSSRPLQDVFKTSSRHLQDVLQRYLQDVFKAYHQVNLFYLTRPREVFNMFLSAEEFA